MATGSEPSRACPVCAAPIGATFLRLPDAPAQCHRLQHSREAALAVARGTLALNHCSACGHVSNSAFDPDLVAYGEDYENALEGSPSFRRYAEELASRLVERYGLRERTIVEIGCGRGAFLKTLCRLGGSRGIGFDPGHRGDAEEADAPDVTIVAGYFDPARLPQAPHAVVCRHVLEHLPEPAALLREIRDALAGAPDGLLYLEVPNAQYVFRDRQVWDLIYEHPQYFSAGSLDRLLTDCGFIVDDLREAYGAQFLSAEARPTGSASREAPASAPDDVPSAAQIARFAAAYQHTVERWHDWLSRLAAVGGRAAVWGAGSKTIAFLNAVGPDGAVPYVVDVNPSKHGCYVPGTGHPIMAPAQVADDPTAAILLLNPIYRGEITAEIAALVPQADRRPALVPVLI